MLSIILIQAVLGELHGTARVRLVGEINTGRLTRSAVVVNNDCTGAAGLVCGGNNVEVVPGHYTT